MTVAETTMAVLSIRIHATDCQLDEVELQRDDDRPVWMTRAELIAASRPNDGTGHAYRWVLATLDGRSGTLRRVKLADAIGLGQKLAVDAGEQQRRHTELLAQRRANAAEADRVADEREQIGTAATWWPIASYELPEGLRFDSWRPSTGGIVETSFGTFSAAEAGPGDDWMKIEDRSERSTSVRRVRYYRRRSAK